MRGIIVSAVMIVILSTCFSISLLAVEPPSLLVALSEIPPPGQIVPGNQVVLMKHNISATAEITLEREIIHIRGALTLQNLSIYDGSERVGITPPNPVCNRDGCEYQILFLTSPTKGGMMKAGTTKTLTLKGDIPSVAGPSFFQIMLIAIEARSQSGPVTVKGIPIIVPIFQLSVPSKEPLLWVADQTVQQREGVPVMVNSRETGKIFAFEIVMGFDGGMWPSQVKSTLPTGWLAAQGPKEGSPFYPGSPYKYDQLSVIGVGSSGISEQCPLFELLYKSPGISRIVFTKVEINGGPSEGGRDLLAEGQVRGGTIEIQPSLRIECSSFKEPLYPNLTIAQMYPVLKVGESMTLIVRGGTPPYAWEIAGVYNPRDHSTLDWNTWKGIGTPVFSPEKSEEATFKSSGGWMRETQCASLWVGIGVIDAKAREVEAIIHVMPRYGDPTGDGEITVSDALKILQALVNKSVDGRVPLYPAEAYAADVNGNRVVSSLDVVLILQYVAEIIKEFPVETQAKGAPPRQQVSVDTLITQLEESGKVDQDIINILRKAREIELSRWAKTLPATWGKIRNSQ